MRSKKSANQIASDVMNKAMQAQPGIYPIQGRKTIHVSASIDSVGKYFVLAVCDDGSMWQLSNLYREHGEPHWERFPSPPIDPKK